MKFRCFSSKANSIYVLMSSIELMQEVQNCKSTTTISPKNAHFYQHFPTKENLNVKILGNQKQANSMKYITRCTFKTLIDQSHIILKNEFNKF